MEVSMTSSFVSLPRAAAVGVAITVLASSMAAAQTPVVSPPTGETAQTMQLGTPAFARLVQGTEVRITTADGTRLKAVVVAFSPTGMTLADKQRQRTSVPFDQIVKVKKVTHRVRNG